MLSFSRESAVPHELCQPQWQSKPPTGKGRRACQRRPCRHFASPAQELELVASASKADGRLSSFLPEESRPEIAETTSHIDIYRLASNTIRSGNIMDWNVDITE